jgi:hypothetical protein
VAGKWNTGTIERHGNLDGRSPELDAEIAELMDAAEAMRLGN